MNALSREQRKLLIELFNNPLSSINEIPDEKLSTIAYLKQLGYVDIQTKNNTSALPNGFTGVSTEVTHIGVSEKGKAYLYEYRVTLLCFILPTSISLASLAISIFALFLK